jgi:hypothetical protein
VSISELSEEEQAMTDLHGDALTYSNDVSIDMEITDYAAKISRCTSGYQIRPG